MKYLSASSNLPAAFQSGKETIKIQNKNSHLKPVHEIISIKFRKDSCLLDCSVVKQQVFLFVVFFFRIRIFVTIDVEVICLIIHFRSGAVNTFGARNHPNKGVANTFCTVFVFYQLFA